MTGTSNLHATFHEGVEIHFNQMFLASGSLAGLKHLFDCVHQTIGIFEHETVKLSSLPILKFPPLQRLQVQSQRSDWSFQLVGDRVDEAVMLLVLADFADQKAGVQDESGDDGAEE